MEGDDTRGWKAGTPVVFKGTAVNEVDPQFSPDGRWVAYTSQESGTTEVYVSSYPGPGAAVRISAGGGAHLRWSPTSHELVFWDGSKIVSVPFTVTSTFVPGKPQRWAPQDVSVDPDFEFHPDGKRMAVRLADAEARRAAAYSLDRMVFWSGFADYLRKNVVMKK